ncbi:MAG TPA: DUF2269 family protein [Balneolaceae bacterium]
MAYFLFKFIHIAAAIIWIGSVFTLGMLNIALARKRDRPGLAAIARQSEFFGRAVIGPSAITTLIAGIVLSAFFGFGAPFWIIWGLAVILITGYLGSNVTQKVGIKLAEVAASDDADDSKLQVLQRRLTILTSINLLLLFSAVWVMVFKPVL